MKQLVLFIALLLLVFSEPTSVDAIMPGGTGLSYLPGLGTSSWETAMVDNAPAASFRSNVDFIHARPFWKDVVPSKRSMNWGLLDGYVALAAGKPLLLAVKLRSTYWDTPCGPGFNLRQYGNCYDGSPAWAIAPEYTPVMSALQPGLPMIDFSNSALQSEIAWLIQQLSSRKTSGVWPDSVYLMLALGADSEAFPDDGAETIRYRDTFGERTDPLHPEYWPAIASDKWIAYAKAMVNAFNTYAHGEERIYIMSPHFVSSLERHSIISYILTQPYGNEWAFYTETVNPGYLRNNWSQIHAWNGIYSYGTPTDRLDCVYVQYSELADATRCLGRTHPVYSEVSVSDNTNAPAYKRSWFAYWVTLTCAWQRIDGCGLLRQWTEQPYLSGTMATWYNALHIQWSGGTGVTLPLSNRRADTSPEAWAALHQDGYGPTRANNFFQFLDQIDTTTPTGLGADACDGITSPAWYIPETASYITQEYANVLSVGGKASPYSAFTRKIPNCAYFTVDPLSEGWWPGGNGYNLYLSVIYLDQGVDAFSVQYWTGSTVATALTTLGASSVTKVNSGDWVREEFVIPSGAYSFRSKAMPGSGGSFYFDFRINSLVGGGGIGEYVHMAILNRDGPPLATFTPTPQTVTPSSTPTRTPTRTPTWTPGGVTATPTPTATPTSTPTPRPPGGAGVQSYYLASGSDDAYDRTSWCTTTSAILGGAGAEDITTGFRFSGITKPSADARVQSAFLHFVAQETHGDSISLVVHAQKSASTVTFDCTSNKPSARPTSTAYEGWAPEAWIVGTERWSPDINAALNEVLDYAGGSWDGSLVVLVSGVAANGLRVPYNREANSNLAAVLEVTWYTTNTPTPTVTPTPTTNPATSTPAVTALPTDTVLLLDKDIVDVQAGDEALLLFQTPAGILNTATLHLYVSDWFTKPTWEFSEDNDNAVPGTWTTVVETVPDCDIILDTTIKQSGAGSYSADKGSDNTTACYVTKSGLSTGVYTRLQLYFRYDVLDASNGIPIVVGGASVNDYYVGLRSDGALQIYNYGNASTYVGATVLAAATFYKVTVSAYHANTGGWIRLLINGQEEIYQSGIDTLNSADPGTKLYAGQISSNSIVSDYWFDSVRFASQSSDFVDPTVEVYLMRRQWVSAYTTWWSWYHSAVPPEPWALWQVAGAYGPLDSDPDPYASYRVSDTNWVYMTIAQLASQWQSANYGLLLRLKSPVGGEHIRLGGRYSNFKPYVIYTTR